jgi:hypothetical protein
MIDEVFQLRPKGAAGWAPSVQESSGSMRGVSADSRAVLEELGLRCLQLQAFSCSPLDICCI